MNRGALTICLLLSAAVMIGCWQASPPDVPVEPAAGQTGSEDQGEVDLAAICYRTDNKTKWPDYQFPLEHSFDCPEVPPEIVGPFSADDIPAEEEEE